MQCYNPGTNNFYSVPSYQPQVTPQSQNNTFAWVQGEEAAKVWPVAPGNTIILIDSDKPIMYMKTTDLSGRPQPMEIRYLVSQEDYEKIQNGSNSVPNSEEYVTKATFEKYIEEASNKFVLKRRDK